MTNSPMTGQSIDYQRFAGSRGRGDGGRGGFGGATPAREPAWSSGRTPMVAPQGGRTPAWADSSRSKHSVDTLAGSCYCANIYSPGLVWRLVSEDTGMATECNVGRPHASLGCSRWEPNFLRRCWKCKLILSAFSFFQYLTIF